MNESDDFTIRRNDFSLDDGQQALRESFRSFLERNCPMDVVRKSEPLGWDETLWAALGDLRAVATAIGTDLGGDGGGLVEMALICEEAGRRAAPVPLVDSVVAARLLARIATGRAVSALKLILDRDVASVAVGPPGPDGRVLTSSGALADVIIGLRDDDLVLCRPSERPVPVANLASAPLAWCRTDQGEIIESGARASSLMAQARREWKLLTAATLVGLGEAANQLGVQYAKDRLAFGVPIGSLQAIAHPLADAAIGIEGARRLTWKACWFADHEPSDLGHLPEIAFVHAAESAERAGFVTIHSQGGFGFTLESDAQIFYRRAKGTALVAGDRHADIRQIGRAYCESVATRGANI